MIILSIPYINNEFVTNRTKKDYPSADYIEYRLDYNNNPFGIPHEVINEKTILTNRLSNHDDIEKTNKLYNECIEKHNCLVNIDISNVDKFSVNADNLILSYHNFEEDWKLADIKVIIEKANKIPSKITKIALNIKSYNKLLELEHIAGLSTKPIIIVGMGKLGKLSRIIYKNIGSYATYISLKDNPTAEGQLTIDEMKLYRIKQNISSIGGIIGGEQIKNSLGLKHYNHVFSEKDISSVYAPFVVDDFDDFQFWLSNTRLPVYGFSVTMPYKSMFDNPKDNLGVYNLITVTNNMYSYFNTDIDALNEALHKLNINNDDTIVVLGTGSTAKLTLHCLKNFDNVLIVGRNQEKGQELAQKYSKMFISFDDIPAYMFNVLINCTPIGTKVDKPPFLLDSLEKVIDLPYIKGNTSIINYCIDNKISFYDGKMFWKKQAEKQEKLFLKTIKTMQRN